MAHEILILTGKELRELVKLDDVTLVTVEEAFCALAAGGVVMPPIMSLAMPQVNGEVDIKTAYIPGLDRFAIKASSGFFDNPKRGLPSLGGLMVALSARTGQVEALLVDNGYLTDIRTAAAGAVAARYLAPAEVETAGVLGTGVQARLQIEAASLVRSFSRVLVWGRNADRAAQCAADLAAKLGIDVRVEPDPARLVAQSQLVVTTTPARAPVLMAEWLHPGLHITAMGSDQEDKNEIDPAAFARLDSYVADRVTQCAALGELRSALAAGIAGIMSDTIAIPELGAVIGEPSRGRTAETDITLCDLTGTGAQDTAIADLAVRLARTVGAGSTMMA